MSKEQRDPAACGLFRSRDGTPLYYEVRGKGRPLVFCYGLTCRMTHWRHQLQHFESMYQVICLDYRGHHRSPFPKNRQNMTVEWLARDVEDLMNHLQLKEAVCLGHSMGVPVVCGLAKNQPERVKGLVFVCGTVQPPFDYMFNSKHMQKVFRVGTMLFRAAPDWTSRAWKRLTRGQKWTLEIVSRLGFNRDLADMLDVQMYLEGVSLSSLDTFISLLEDYNRHDARSVLEHIRCPTLVIAGEKDHITPMQLSKTMAHLLPKAELEAVPLGSHNVHMEFPDVVNRRIECFLRELSYE